MSLPVPLAVRLQTSKADRHITRHVQDLWFRSAIPGGFAACRISLHRPIDVPQADIAHFGRLYVYDTRNGVTAWEGEVEEVGRSASDSGEVWEIGAVGPMVHTRDRTIPLIYVDSTIESSAWARVVNTTPGASASIGADPGSLGGAADDQALNFQFPGGLPLVTNSIVTLRYDKLQQAGQHLARYDYTDDEGRTHANLHVQGVTRTNGSLSGGEVSRTATFSTAGHSSSPKIVTTNWTVGRNTLEIRILWDGGAVTVGDDVTWAAVRNIVIQATRYDANGFELTAASNYSTNTVSTLNIINDVVGRFLVDRYRAVSIETGGFDVDHMTYPDGVTAYQVLDDLMSLNATDGYHWLVYDQVDDLGNPELRSTMDGRYGFSWQTAPTDVGYQASSRDGIDLPDTSADLYNAVTVRWRNIDGAVHSMRLTQAVTELDDAGLTREGFIDLGSEMASVANATQAGTEFLGTHARRQAAGRLTVAHPVTYYRSTHWGVSTLQPWQVRPFEVIRVTDLAETGMIVSNPDTPDGVTSFFVVATEYRASTNTAELALDRHPSTTTYGLAPIVRREPRGRWSQDRVARR